MIVIFQETVDFIHRMLLLHQVMLNLKKKSKFEQKLLVWVAISPKGLSKHYVAPSGQAVNENVYIDKCLRSCLLPFIETVHKDDEIVF